MDASILEIILIHIYKNMPFMTNLDEQIIKETTHKRPLVNIIVFLMAIFLLGAWLGYKIKYQAGQRVINHMYYQQNGLDYGA